MSKTNKSLIMILAMLSLGLLETACASQNIFNQLYTGTRDNYTGRVGFSFRAERDCAITSLGRTVNLTSHNGVLQHDHVVELFEIPSGNLLASVIVTNNSPRDLLGYAYEVLDHYVVINSDMEYMILSEEAATSDDPWSDAVYMTNYNSSVMTILGAEYGGGPGDPMPTVQYNWGVGTAYGPPTYFYDDQCASDCDAEDLLIDPESLTATASSTSGYGTPAINAINGSGMTSDAHDTNYNNMWLSGSHYGNEWYKINLGAEYVLNSMMLWNYNQPPAYNCRGVKQADIYWSNSVSDPDDGGQFNTSNWNLLGIAGERTFSIAPGANDYSTPDSVLFEGMAVRWVVIKINSYHLDSGLHDVGISEVRFYRASSCASLPSPENGAVDIHSSVTLEWQPGNNAVLHNIYVGKNYTNVCWALTSSPEYQNSSKTNRLELNNLDFNATYYWRIDEVVGEQVYKGKIWSFTTGQVGAQYIYPSNNDIQIYPYHNNLRWIPGASANSHNVYIGTSRDSLSNATTSSQEFKGTQIETYYSIESLPLGQTYYWRVDEVDSYGTYKGDVWSFTMANPLMTGYISAIEDLMPDIPSPYVMRDWKQVARNYDDLFFDFDAQGQYLPLICWDTTGYNTGRPMFSTRGGYIGDFYSGCSGHLAEEIELIIGSTLCGIDKSHQWCENSNRYENYVLPLENFFDPSGGVYAYTPGGTLCCGSGWYINYSAQIFTDLYWLYNKRFFTGDLSGNSFDQDFATQAVAWFDAGKKWGGNIEPWIVPTEIPKGIYFPTMEVANDWVSDAPAGYAWIMYMAYAHLNNPDYLLASEWGLQALLKNTTNPGKEMDIFHAPITAARLNAEHGRKYDLQKLLEWCMGANHPNGWGIISNNGVAYNGWDMHGLVGADWASSGGGGFAGSTFDGFRRLLPVARYDDRYAHSIGKFALNCANACRLYYGNALPQENYYSEDIAWINSYDHNYCMPTEIVRMTAYRYNKAVADYETLYGNMQSGAYNSTVGLDNNFQALSEQVAGDTTALEHIWEFNVQPANNNRYSLDVWGYAALDSGGDTGFTFSWATNPAESFHDLFTVRATGVQWHRGNFDLILSQPTKLYIKVRDNNRGSNDITLATLFIDRMEVIQECQWGPEPAGDAIAAGWNKTNLAPYCGHRVGLIGASIEKTNVEGILQLDLLSADVFHDPVAFPTYLYYNPYDTKKTVNVEVGAASIDIYDSVSNSFLKTGVTGSVSFDIPAKAAVVVVLAPTNGVVTYNFKDGKQQTIIDGVIVDYVSSMPADFNADNDVDFEDFAILALRWLNTCNLGNNWCEGADIDHNGNVNLADLCELAQMWLQ